MKSSVLWLTLSSGLALGLPTEALKETDVEVPMRDGVQLSANVFRPDAPGRYPVILLRTPYGKAEMQELAEALPQYGYAAVWQDVRGKFGSEGKWEPAFQEGRDGYDTVEWAARQPWSTGDVVMIGGSYAGLVQWLAAKERPPHLRGLIPFVSPGDLYEDFFFEGGTFLLGAGVMWAVVVDGSSPKLANLLDLPWSDAFNHLPVREALATVGHNPSYFRDWLAHPTNDAYWRQASWDADFPGFDLPALHIGGWYDIFQKGTIENFRRMTTRGHPAARGKQHLLIGPWGHQGTESGKVGEVDFGSHARLNWAGILGPFLREAIQGEKPDAAQLPPVRVFTMGENKWNDYPAWPVPGTRFVDYHLRSGALLTTAKPTANEPSDHYVYDPANPVPTRGGGNCCWPQVIPWGPMDQRDVEGRDDVLLYTTPPLDEDLRVTGPVEIKLWIASSAPDTDFTGKLVDVAPDGFAMNLTDGIQRVAYRRGYGKAERLRPGKATEITIDLWNTSHLFRKGHRIRVEIASSNFPRYSRNLNTGRQPETETRMVKARQTVLHDLDHRSRIVLPVLPEP